MTIIEKIRAEIERLYNDKAYSEDRWDLGYDCACEDIMSFLSTLESEKPINPDDAMKKLDEKIAAAYQLGLADKEKQMLKEAVDTIVEDWNPDPEPEITIPLNPEEFTCGDKVRVIVCKKEDREWL